MVAVSECGQRANFNEEVRERGRRDVRFNYVWGIGGIVLFFWRLPSVLHSSRRFAPRMIDQLAYKKVGGLTICGRCRKNCAITASILARSMAPTAANWLPLWAVI